MVVVSLPHRAEDAIRQNADLSGRLSLINIEAWEKEDLKEIVLKGFKQLDIKITDEVAEQLAVECPGFIHGFSGFGKIHQKQSNRCSYNSRNGGTVSYTHLVHLQLFEDAEFDYLLRQQMDKDFYIPSAQQIDEICRIGYEASSSAYKKLESFFTKKLKFSYEQAVTWCLQVWANSYEGESPSKIINKMTEANIEFEEKMINELPELLVAAHNNTRMKENRGYKPSEMVRKKSVDKMPTIVPASSNAAAILKDAAPQLEAMGVPVDLNGNTDVIQTTMFPSGLNGEPIRVEKKIYPNDPCPCGSGKKYKKCCGKKN